MDNKVKIDKIYAVAVWAVLFIILVQIVIGEGIYKLTGVDLGIKQTASKTNDINWADIYPFSYITDNVTDSESDINVWSGYNIFHKLQGFYSRIMPKFESIGEIWVNHIYGYSDLAKTGYVIRGWFSDPGLDGEYVRMDNGYWTTVNEVIDCYTVETNAELVQNFGDYLEKSGIPFMYIQTAKKNCKYDIKLQEEFEDYTNVNIDKFLDALDGIDYIDMREFIHRDYDDHYALFYKTDHHWNVDAGLWACNVIEQEALEKYGIEFNTVYNDSSMYRRVIYENAMFGSAGQAVTHFAEQSEDFSILFPNFDTYYHLVIPDNGIDEVGTFEDIFVDYDGLDEVISNGGGYAYEKMLYGNRPLVQITNYRNEDGPKVLVIRDSFSIAVSMYMAMGCSELDLIDTRPKNGNFNGSVRTYIDQMQPDIVMVITSDPLKLYE